MKASVLLTALAASLLVTTAASAAKHTFSAPMDPGQENIAPELGDHNPTGKVTATFDDVTKELCGKVEYSDLTGIATGVHIHRAPAGNPEGDSAPTDKVEIPPTASPVNFNIKLSADFEKGLNDGELYANVHTTANTKGELRSQSPWIQNDALGPIPCPPATPGADAGATDAGSSSSSSSSSGGATTSSSGAATSSSGSSNSGDDDDSTGSSSSGSTGAKDAGAAPKKAADAGGCNTTGDGGHLGFALVLGVGIAALSRVRRRKRR